VQLIIDKPQHKNNNSTGGCMKYVTAILFAMVCFVMLTVNALGQATLVNYDFNSGTSDATLSPALASGVTSTFSSTEAWITYTGIVSGAQAFTSNSTAGTARGMANSSGTDTKYYTFVIGGSNLPNYASFKVYFQAQRSASGAQTLTVKYSLNGGTFTAFTNNTMAPGNGSMVEGLFTLPAAVDNPSTSLEIRIYASGASGSGTTRIDNIQIQGTLSAVPILSVNPSNLNLFSYIAGSGPSVSKSYNLSGLNLTGAPGNITVTGSTNYEVSIDNSSFASSVNVGYTSATLSSTQIYVRLKSGLISGSYNSEPVSNSGGGASAAIVSCSGDVLPTPSTYTWQGGTGGDWTVAENWNPSRTSPAVNDILLINDGTSEIIINVPTQTIGKLTISNNTSVELQSSSSITLTIYGGTGVDLDIQSGSSLNIAQAANTINISVQTGATSTIGGSVSLSSAAHKLTSVDASGITFQSGSTFTAGTAFSGNAFGTTSINSIVFASGSTYNHVAGSNPFGATAPSSVVVWQSGSTYKHKSTGAPSLGNRVYANLEFDEATGASFTSSSPLTCENLIATTGVWSLGVKAQFDIKGNISVASGATLNLIPTTAGTIAFNGTSTQSISGSGTLTANTFQSFTVNNSTGLTLNKALTNTGNLTLTTGKVTLGSNILNVSAISGGSASAYVDVSSTGELQKSVSAIGAFTLPIGDASNYSPVSIDITAADAFSSAYIGVKLSNTKELNNSSTTDYLNRYWTVTSSGLTNPLYSATFTYLPTDVAGSESNLIGGKYDGSWTTLGAVNTGTHSFTGSGLSTFSVFTAGENSAMPVELAAFTGKGNRLNVELWWNTAMENNNHGFEVEKNISHSWQKIGFVQGAGTSNASNEYRYVDKNTKAGTYQYRLKQIDRDGSFKYSQPVEVAIGTTTSKIFTLSESYPNPFNPTTNIEFTFPNEGRATVKVINMLGQQVAELFNGQVTPGRIYQATFDATRFSSGLYFSVLEFNGQKLVRKMLLAK
jgi:hypothetical protein